MGKEDPAVVEIVGGGFAGMGGTLVAYPFDTAKVRLQTPRLGFKGVGDCIMISVCFKPRRRTW